MTYTPVNQNAFDATIRAAAESDGVGGDFEKLARKNLETLHETRKRIQRWGYSVCELEAAIEETEAALNALRALEGE